MCVWHLMQIDISILSYEFNNFLIGSIMDIGDIIDETWKRISIHIIICAYKQWCLVTIYCACKRIDSNTTDDHNNS